MIKKAYKKTIQKWVKKLLHSDPHVTVIRLQGVIGQVSSFKSGLKFETCSPLIEKAFSDKKSKAICLMINSPGGSPVQSSLIAKLIQDLAKEKKKKVYAFVEDVAASGGYWLACAADEIYVDRASIVGSIGVISSGFGFQKLLEKHGIERRVYTAGKSKSILDPFLDEKPEDIKKLKKIQTELHDVFINAVKESRKERYNQDNKDLFTGEIFSGGQAVEHGLADGIGDLTSKMKDIYGKKVKFKMIEDSKSFLQKKLSLQAPDPLDAVSEKVISYVEERLFRNYYS